MDEEIDGGFAEGGGEGGDGGGGGDVDRVVDDFRSGGSGGMGGVWEGAVDGVDGGIGVRSEMLSETVAYARTGARDGDGRHGGWAGCEYGMRVRVRMKLRLITKDNSADHEQTSCVNSRVRDSQLSMLHWKFNKTL